MLQARKKLMACIFALTIVIIFMSILTPQADAIEGNAYTWSGSGTAEDPYLISTPDQLQEIATENEGAAGFPNIYFKQTADLVFDGAEK